MEARADTSVQASVQASVDASVATSISGTRKRGASAEGAHMQGTRTLGECTQGAHAAQASEARRKHGEGDTRRSHGCGSAGGAGHRGVYTEVHVYGPQRHRSHRMYRERARMEGSQLSLYAGSAVSPL